MALFLTTEQIKALEAAIQKARTCRGIQSVIVPDGEAFAYQFNSEVYWHVYGDDYAKIAKGTVPLYGNSLPR